MQTDSKGAVPLKARLLRYLGTAKHDWSRKRILRSIRKYRSDAPDVSFDIDFFGMRYAGRLTRHIDYDVYMYGAYAVQELHVIDCVAKMLRRSTGKLTVGLDIGANAGHHTLFLSPRFDQVIALEPYAESFQRLTTALQANKIANVVCCPFGLGDRNAFLPFTPPSSANEGVGSFHQSGSSLMLETRSGDAFVEEKGLEAVDFIKIDVEGFEGSVLKGLASTLSRFRPLLLIESEENEWPAARQHLYDDHVLFGVKATQNRRMANLIPGGEGCNEILVLPAEKADLFLDTYAGSKPLIAV